MYTEHPICITPPDDTIVWKYMDLNRLLDLVNHQALYFASKNQFEDTWEGEHFANLKSRIKLLPVEKQQHLIDMYQHYSSQMLFNCWHENKFESVAMWKLYTSDKNGIAIKSTIGRIKQALTLEPRSVNISRITYLDYSDESLFSVVVNPSTYNILEPILCKRPNFQHEQEVRLLMPYPAEIEFKKATSKLTPKLGDTFYFKGATVSQFAKINVRDLIETIIVSPSYPLSGIESLKSTLTALGADIQVVPSALLATPMTT